MPPLRAAMEAPAIRVAFLLLAAGAAAVVLAKEWNRVAQALSAVDVAPLAGALACALLNVLLAGLSWRKIAAALGQEFDTASAARIYFLGQLGKYLPGGLWNFVAAAELGRTAGATRTGTMSTLVLATIIGLGTGAVVALGLLPLSGYLLPRRDMWMAAGAIPLLGLFHPRVLRRALSLIRVEVDRSPRFGDIAASAFLAIAAWGFAGAQLSLLMAAISGRVDVAGFALVTGAYALAWVVGFVVMVAPAGIGAREATLTVMLASQIGTAEAFTLAVLSRLVTTAADLMGAGLTVALTRR